MRPWSSASASAAQGPGQVAGTVVDRQRCRRSVRQVLRRPHQTTAVDLSHCLRDHSRERGDLVGRTSLGLC
jgi:hypothetical protein